jgi:hypothetical protein
MDSNRGYTQDNVVITCWVVNHMKSNLTYQQFIELCGQIYNNKK